MSPLGQNCNWTTKFFQPHEDFPFCSRQRYETAEGFGEPLALGACLPMKAVYEASNFWFC